MIKNEYIQVVTLELFDKTHDQKWVYPGGDSRIVWQVRQIEMDQVVSKEQDGYVREDSPNGNNSIMQVMWPCEY